MSFEAYGNIEMDARSILMCVLHKLSPHVPVELTQADFDALHDSERNGPALHLNIAELVGLQTMTIEVIDAHDAIKLAKINNVPRQE